MPVELLEMIKNGGAALSPVFAFLWWMERDERKALAAELKVIAKDAVTAIVGTKESVEGIKDLFTPTPPVRRGK